jgi:hypothetical protein
VSLFVRSRLLVDVALPLGESFLEFEDQLRMPAGQVVPLSGVLLQVEQQEVSAIHQELPRTRPDCLLETIGPHDPPEQLALNNR